MIVTGIAVTIFAINLEKLNVPSYQNVVHTSIRNEKSTPDYYIAQRENLLNAFHALTDEESKKLFVHIFCLRVAPHLAEYSSEEL